MRSVNVAKLKNELSKYLRFVKNGEAVIIRDRNLPVAKLVPFSTEGLDEHELKLVAAGKMRLPEIELDPDEFDKMPIGRRVTGRKVTRALLADREEGL